ncbi:MAG TPA: YqgE/AlgH family protein [Vulgatibacter sp.]|nr:YqgE/AlgH family protein [Vulgatibacter sp.]
MTFKSLAPSLLLAAPRLEDPNFERRVVLLGRHEEEGALGWVLNGDAVASVAEMLFAADLVPPGIELPETLAFRRSARIGGPVHVESGWLLYRRASASFAGELSIGDEVAICSNQDAVRAIVKGEEPKDFRLVLGYAGWGPGQLESELKEGVWLPGPAQTSLIFDTQRAALWDAALQEATGAANVTFQGKSWGLA